MNEKFSLLKSLLLLASFSVFEGGAPLFKTISHAHQALSQVRARCFYAAHSDLLWQEKGGDIGFYRESDRKFYKLIETETSSE